VIRMVFALMVTLAAMLGGALWLVGQRDSGGLGVRPPPALRTVDVGDLLESALRGAEPETRSPADSAAPAAPEAEVVMPQEPVREIVEEEVPEPAPFAEAPLAEPDSTRREGDAEASPSAPAAVDAAPRDQDAWALLIRRMLSLYRRMSVGVE
jgi:hypothetical protein